MQMEPIGLRPKVIVDQLRIQEINEAIARYTKAGKKIPIEWLEEQYCIVHKNDILESTLREVDDILREAIIALDNGRKVNGLEFARSGIDYTLSTKLKGDVENVKSDKYQK